MVMAVRVGVRSREDGLGFHQPQCRIIRLDMIGDALNRRMTKFIRFIKHRVIFGDISHNAGASTAHNTSIL